MREFMTKVSDYFNEWREDPERRENRLSVVVIGAVAVVIIVLLLLLLWWGHSAQEKRKEEATKKAAELQSAQEQLSAWEAEEAKGLVAATYEEKMKEYMSTDSGEELRQEYLTNTNALAEKIRELQTTMEKVQSEIASIVKEYEGGDGKVTEKLTVLEKETKSVVEKINALEVKMTDLTELIRMVDGEKIPLIQGQIGELRGEIEQARTDISGVHEKIKALEKEDEKLWEKLSKVEKSLETVLQNNMKEIDKRIDHLGDDIDALERELKAALEKMSEKINERMDVLSSDALSYRYEENTNTLYLMPNQEHR
ncbi:MAG: hypothetical protein K2N43_05865 [Lachnospiraceae bacterium]|nr:hypothetical protein [Lachnospiraceae bacterium]